MLRSTVGDVMTTDVATVGANATFKEIVEVLTQRRVSGVPVVDGDGKVTTAHTKAAAVLARDLMSTPAVTIAATAPAVEAAQALAQGRFRQLPVVDGEGRLVGMITARTSSRHSGPPTTPPARAEPRRRWTRLCSFR